MPVSEAQMSAGLSQRGVGISRAELDQLKEDAAICLNEPLFRKLQQIEEVC